MAPGGKILPLALPPLGTGRAVHLVKMERSGRVRMKRVPLSLSGNDEEDAEEAILQRVLHVSQLSAAAEEQHLATAAIVEEAAVEADEAEPAQEKKAIEKEAHQEATVRVDATASEDSNEKGAGDLNFELAPLKCPIADPAMNVALQHTSACIRLAGNDACHREANTCGLQHSDGSKIDSEISAAAAPRAAAVGSKLEEEVHVVGASLIGFTSGASVNESRVRHFWTFGSTSGAPDLPLKSRELCGKTRHSFFGSTYLKVR